MIAVLALVAVVTTTADAAIRKAVRPVAAKPATPVVPAVPVDWTKRVALTPDGGFLVGNPAAKAKLVEYGSLSCPYCHLFYSEANEPLTERIASGDVSFEYRPFAVHSMDPILHALLRCAGRANFLSFYHDYYRGQPKLIARWELWNEENKNTDPNLTAASRIRYAEDWNIAKFALAHGLTRARVVTCLSNNAALAAQSAREEAAAKMGIHSTPSFLLNGKIIAGSRWYEIDAAISDLLNAPA